MLLKLPSAYFSGVRVKYVDEASCQVSVPFKWFSQNPFRSTYFACLAMAAEMSTGILAMAQTYKRNPAVSMLVTALEATYSKKATGITIFTCDQGPLIQQAVAKAVATGEAQTIRVRSLGRNSAGEEVAEFFINWSFKIKQS
ncbi:MAG: thioesterase [Flavihumibacter sp. CACIAM 22H1]|nr:MAG: thioesterase [Flavihumibacter sp. CACIAM 22H1]